MFIPSTMPENLADMLAFLQPSVEDGLFDSVEYDDADNPTKIICTQSGKRILDVVFGDYTFTFTPYYAENAPVTQSARKGFINTQYTGETYYLCMRCKGGIGLVSRSLANNRKSFIMIGKCTNGKTAFVTGASVGNTNDDIIPKAPNSYTGVMVTCFGDSTGLAMYSKALYCVVTASISADRTILRDIPICGTYGSTDKFSTLFVREVMQYPNNGEQTIGGKKYGCIYDFAILDE